jgi:hypothetical protein
MGTNPSITLPRCEVQPCCWALSSVVAFRSYLVPWRQGWGECRVQIADCRTTLAAPRCSAICTPHSTIGRALQHQRHGQRTARAMLLGGPSPALFTPLTRYSYSTPDSWPLSVTSLSTDMPTSIQSPLSRVRRWTR